MQRIIFILANLTNSKSFLCKNFFLIVKHIDNLNSYFISRPCDIKRQDLFPNWSHIQRWTDYLCVFYLVLFVHQNLDHWLKLVLVEKLVIKFSFNYIQSERTTFHNWSTVNRIAGRFFLKR